ncbi:hypothetical protein JDV02_004504 [Purpureocillium takamizusanense]|uniref:Uncharacterized protein n=1 Tax=Purpureocillium takamizusanense TaxID=2060973 RepID=A0A9Q8QFD9_9HYPO|nr:uncharacterized protein JDV02_004504 [Purpureocillium takamizusanense]UNI18222.1 hypothetical protein JDV02_004504 [Purpureocillium takamizusanense]
MAPPPPLQLSFTTLDVFTDTRFAGNPLAVVRVPGNEAAVARLTQEVKQRIAREFNLSETVFLHDAAADDDETANGTSSSRRRVVDIFTVDQELPFAGHPTIGTAVLVRDVLRWDHVDTLVTKAGAIGITVEGAAPHDDDDAGAAPSSSSTSWAQRLRQRRILAQIPHDVHVHTRTLRDILGDDGSSSGGMLGEEEAVLAARAQLSDDAATREAELAAPAVSIVRGMTFLLVELPSVAHLARVNVGKRLDFGGGLARALLDEGPWHDSFVSRYYYVKKGAEEEGESKSSAAWSGHTRMVELDFEDPATGSAACTLASYLVLSGKVAGGGGGGKKLRFDIVQGEHMGRRSDIAVEIHTKEEEEAGRDDDGSGLYGIDKLFLGGTAVPVMEGTITV